MRYVAILLLLAGCSQGLHIVSERTVDPATGKLTGCRTEILSGEDKSTIAQAKRSMTVNEECKTTINFGSTEEAAGDQVAKAINALLTGLTPLIKGATP